MTKDALLKGWFALALFTIIAISIVLVAEPFE